MNSPRRRKNRLPARSRRRADHRPSPTVALAVSLLVHTMLVLLLYEAYSELAGPPLPSLEIVARDRRPRRATAPSFAVSDLPLQDTQLHDGSIRPTPHVPSLPRQQAAANRRLAGDESVYEWTDDAETTAVDTNQTPRRKTAQAVLPAAKVELPVMDVTSVAVDVGATAAAPPITPLERADTLSEIPYLPNPNLQPRIASRLLYGSLAHRQTALAMLAANEIAAARPARRRRPADAFAQRGAAGGTPPECDVAIERGLDFLARVQSDDGRWRFDDLRGAIDPDVEPVNIRADAAATGLALLAFLGAGHDHFDGRYRLTIQDGLDYLTGAQQSSGELFADTGQPTGQVARFYSHGIATLALCEAYGMTGDDILREPAQRALEFLAATQHPEMGGWRYLPDVNTDLSVTGWQLIALRSGQLAGLDVRSETLARIGECLEMCRDDAGRPGLFRYSPWASPNDPLTQHGRQPSTVMTSVGLAMEVHLGADPAVERLRLGAEHLLANLPQLGESPLAAPVGTLGNPQRDTYYWYYGTQAMYYLGGEYRQAWSGRLEPLLVESQSTTGRLAGSWDPIRPVPDKWAAYGGRLYVTALNLLSLEIHRRHLPLDQSRTPRIAEGAK